MKKKLMALMLVLSLIFSFNTMAYATDNATFTTTIPDSGGLRSGDSFTATFTVPAVSGFASLKLGVHFNNSVLTVTNLELPTQVADGKDAIITSVDEANTAGAYAISYAGMSNISMTAPLVLKATFVVKDGVEAKSYSKLLEIQEADYDFTDENDDPILSKPTLEKSFYDVKIIKAPITTVNASVSQPVKGSALATSVDIGGATAYTAEAPVWYKGSDFTGEIATGNAEASQVYTVKVTLKAKTEEGENFATSELTVPTGYNVVSNDGTTLVLKKTFAETDARTLTGLAITGYTGVAKQHGETISKDELAVTATFDSGSPDTNYKNYEIVYSTGTALTKGDTKIKVKNGTVESAEYSLGITVAGKTLTADAFTFAAPSLTYDGTDKIDTIKSAASAKTGVGTPTFTVKKDEAGVAEAKNAGEYKLFVSASEGTVYAEGSDIELGTVTIQQKSISGAAITFGTQGTYNGTAQDVVITSVMDGTNALTKGVDYNIVSGESATDVKEQTLTIEGIGNYKDTAVSSSKWKLSQKSVDASMIASVVDEAYTGSEIKPEPAVTGLTKGTDFDYSYENNTYVGTAKVKITGKGNYTGTAEKSFNIVAADQSPTITPTASLKKGGKTLNLTTLVNNVKGGAEVSFEISTGDAATLSGTTLTTDVTKTGEVKINVKIAAKDVGGDSEVEYKAYTGTNAITVTVNDKDTQSALTINSATSVVYGKTLKLSTSGGSGEGLVSYEIVTGGTGTATISGNVLTPTKAGTVLVKATKAADADYNEVSSTPVTITIEQAAPTGTPSYTKITEANKTLADAALAVGTLNPSAGELKWVDDSDSELSSSTTVEKNKAYKWKFIPTDTNYKAVTGKITPYYVAPAGSGYIPTIQKPTIEAGEGVKVTLSTDGTVATITVEAGYDLADVVLNGVSKGKVTEVKGLKTGDKLVVTAAKKATEPTKEDILATLADQKLVARSKVVTMKNGKKAVRITWYNQNGEMMEFDGVEIFRSTKRNSGYGKKPIFTSETGKYYNTAVKVGTKYYYKVRGFVEIDGQKYYTDWSLKAWRTVK